MNIEAWSLVPISKKKRQAHQSSINEKSLGNDNFRILNKWAQTPCEMGEVERMLWRLKVLFFLAQIFFKNKKCDRNNTFLRALL